MAVERLNRIVKEKGENAIQKLSSDLKLPKFKQAEIQFLKDYARVMKPVAQALNILQGENNDSNAYMGYLAPTISMLKEKLHQKKSSTPGLEPLVDALLSGIEKRFKSMLEDEKIIAAAILHPKFKDQWTNDNDILQKGIFLIREKLGTQSIGETGQDLVDTEIDDDDNEFFQVKKKASVSELELFLDSPSDELAIYSRFPQLRQVFIELNTPLPASAACERLFSCAGLIFRPHRCSMKDENFENSLLVKLNKKHWQ